MSASDSIHVPYIPTPEVVVDAMLKLANTQAGEVIYDLACGDGRIVITAIQQFQASRGVGMDIDAERVLDSQRNADQAGVQTQVEFRQGDVLHVTDLSDADVVTMYLLPELNQRLKPMLQATMKPGARIVSHDFDMGPDWPAEKTIIVMVKDINNDESEHPLFLWTIPDRTT